MDRNLNTTSLNEIYKFLEENLGVKVNNPEIDIFEELGVVGDDFHDMINSYSEKYEINLEEYLWYFHCDEEGQNIGGIFFRPPYARVKRIPVTPKMLANYYSTKKWEISYPKHYIPSKRYDLLINKIIAIVITVIVITLIIQRYLTS